jgi:hypothetical protein
MRMVILAFGRSACRTLSAALLAISMVVGAAAAEPREDSAPIRAICACSAMSRRTSRPGVCTENSVRIDYVTESPNVSGDDRSVLPLPGLVRLAV